MQIQLDQVGKQYIGEWIFKSVSLSFSSDHSYWLSGDNGSGKSTLLKLLAGYLLPSKGTIRWQVGNDLINPADIHRQISICAPYLDLYQEHTLKEAITFHFELNKHSLGKDPVKEVLSFAYLEEARNKLVAQLSSGMKQRFKLSLALLTDNPILLLDEPCANLDEKGIAWYKEKIVVRSKGRLLFVCSNNIDEEHFICDKKINLGDYKN